MRHRIYDALLKEEFFEHHHGIYFGLTDKVKTNRQEMLNLIKDTGGPRHK